MRRLKPKYFLALLLGLSLMAPYFTNFICFKQSQIAHKKTVKQHFNATLKFEDLEKFSFSPKEFMDLDWDGDDEFYLDKKKYDVYKIEQKGDSLIAWAWWDHEESQLEKRFHQMLHQNKNEPLRDKPSISLDKLSKYLAYQSFRSALFASVDDYPNDGQVKICQPFLGIDSPPPPSFK